MLLPVRGTISMETAREVLETGRTVLRYKKKKTKKQQKKK